MTAQRWPRVWTQGLTPTTATPMPLRRAFGQHVSETAARPLTPRPPEGPLTHSDPLRRPGPTACSGVRAGGERGGGSRVCLGPFLRGVKRERGAQSRGAALGRVGEQSAEAWSGVGPAGPGGSGGFRQRTASRPSRERESLFPLSTSAHGSGSHEGPGPPTPGSGVREQVGVGTGV